MSKLWYAGESYYGTNVTYDSGGWTVHVFNSKAERDAWVMDDPSDPNPSREAITAIDANRIDPPAEYGTVDYRVYH